MKPTALLLIAHVAAVIPAITLLLLLDADAEGAGELVGASCLPTETEQGGTERKKNMTS